MDAEAAQSFPGGVEVGSWPVSSSEAKPLADWVVDPECSTLPDSESEDVLHGVDPNEVFGATPPADLSSESDSGISEETTEQSPVALVAAVTMATNPPNPASIYQVVYDIARVGRDKSGPSQEDVISIDLGGWSSQLLFPDSCIVNELPAPSSLEGVLPEQLYPELRLTEEEQKLLTEEGVSLPSNLPLTKAEERILKKVRRKIRNKQSAQDSRRRRKEYIDGLESRAAACSAQNKELQRTVEHLEKHNRSLLAQLQQLQSLIKRTASKGAQTSTCLLIIVVSLALIILPSCSPFRRRSAGDDDRPTGVLSRNILTDPSSSGQIPDPGTGLTRLSEASPELGQSKAAVEVPAFQDSIKSPEHSGSEGVRSNSTGPAPHQTDGQDKPAHADEM